jgi:hypothetical protein
MMVAILSLFKKLNVQMYGVFFLFTENKNTP